MVSCLFNASAANRFQRVDDLLCESRECLRFRTLAKLCAALDCTPGDLLDYDFDPDDLQGDDEA